MPHPSDPRWFRQVLGQYPTGVCVVTATQANGTRAGFVVGSFSSVSLDPPLVAFYPDKKSTSWPKIEAAGKFCINILSADQEYVCRNFSAQTEDKFQGIGTRSAGSGAPIIEGAVAWIDCDLESVTTAGDHFAVLGRVRELDVENSSLPLLFFQGGYGRFAPLSLAVPAGSQVLTDQLRQIDVVRPEMEAVSSDLSARCVATAVVGNDVVVLASAGGQNAGSRATLVGVHWPLVPANASTFAAWLDEPQREDWLRAVPEGPAREEQRQRLVRVRERGFSVGLLNEAQRDFASALDQYSMDPESVALPNLRHLVTQLNYDPADLSDEAKDAIRVIASPIFGRDGTVPFVFSVYGFSNPDRHGGIEAYIDRVQQAARSATDRLNRNRDTGSSSLN